MQGLDSDLARSRVQAESDKAQAVRVVESLRRQLNEAQAKSDELSRNASQPSELYVESQQALQSLSMANQHAKHEEATLNRVRQELNEEMKQCQDLREKVVLASAPPPPQRWASASKSSHFGT